ncbi:MFS transporter [Nocardiopsis aegyptia]|uniref:MFS transporter n=1 Tax=Nocardiopsis aegyptia TaxID=220378 RepID=UPI00366F6887
MIGRRKVMIFAVASFSLFTALCALAPSLFVFGLLRFLAGVGLGGCLPTAIALVTEYARGGRGGSATTTIMTGYHSFLGLLLVYGLNTWLPEIMRAAGYELDAALGLLLALNVGAVIGLVVAGRVADRFGPRPAALGWFTVSALMLAALSVKLPGAGAYVAVLLAGCFVFSSQVLVYAYIGRVFAPANRATALGWAAGVGRLGAITGPILGGLLLTAGLAYPWGFYAFAVIGVLGAVAVFAVRRPGAATAEPTVAGGEEASAPAVAASRD